MSGDPQNVNPQAFQPFDGGRGKRLTVTTSSSSVVLPGIQDDNNRVIITNGGSVSAFVCMGTAAVVATLDSMEILPGTTQVFSVPFIVPGGLYLAGITEAGGTTKISAVVGKGA
jgi:hypothetical protein